MAKINYIEIRKKISKSQAVRDIITERAEEIVEEAKEEMIEEFLQHPITEELKEGSRASNVSNTLGGYGNLFSFIGFNDGDDPTEVIEEILNKYTKLNKRYISTSQTNKGIEFKFRVEYPTFEELENATPYPDNWRDGSWIYGIEHGIFGLRYFLYDEENFDFYEQSRSTTGLEAKDPNGKLVAIRGASQSRPSKYINAILRNFINNIKSR